MQESGTRPGLNLQQDFFFFLSLSHRHQPPREITGPKNPQLREKFWRYRPGSQQSVVISTPPLIVLIAKLDDRVSSSLLRPELFYAEKCSNLSTFHPVPSGGHQTLRGPVLITATITGPRRSTCKQKKPCGPRLRVHRIVIRRFQPSVYGWPKCAVLHTASVGDHCPSPSKVNQVDSV